MHIAYIAFGSNMGNRQDYISQAMNRLKEQGIEIIKMSKLYETEPYGYVEQSNFINGVVKARTEDSPHELLKKLMGIENELQRVREVRWGPRTIDLDILFYDDIVMDTAELKVPHVDIQNRKFVLEPFCDIDPDYVHPKYKKKISELLTDLLKKAEL